MRSPPARLYDLLSEWLTVVDGDGRIVYSNSASQAMLGFSREELLNRPIVELLREGDRAAFVAALARLRSGADEQMNGLEAELPSRAGASRRLRWSGVRDANGELHLAAEDLTETRRAQARLDTQSNLLQRIVDHLPVALFAKDARKDYRYILWNRSCERFYGYRAEEVIGRTDYELFPGKADALRAQDRSAIEKGGPVDVPEQAIDGRLGRVWVRALKVPILDDEGGALLLGLAENLTEQRDMRERLSETEARFRAIVDNLPGVVFRFLRTPNGEMRFLYVSHGTGELFGASPEHYLTRWRDFSIVAPEELPAMRESVERSARTLEPWRLEHRAVLPNGVEKWLYGSAIPHRTASGEVIWDGVYVDITPRKQAELQLEREREMTIASAKMAALGEMAAGIAHEINNPLTVITGKVHQAEVRLAPDAEMREYLRKITAMVDRIARIIRALKSFASERGGEANEARDLGSIVSDTLEFCRSRFQNHGVTLEVGSLPPTRIRCRPVEISQVLLNLLNNAFDAVDALSPGAERRVRIEGRDLGAEVELSVTDSGPGVSPAVRGRLMMPFFTTKPPGKGTGLGLSISKGLVEAHHGRLYLDDASRETRFVFTLPKNPEGH